MRLCYGEGQGRLCEARAVTGRTGRIWTNAPGVVVSDAAGSFQLRNLKKEQSLTTPGNEVSTGSTPGLNPGYGHLKKETAMNSG